MKNKNKVLLEKYIEGHFKCSCAFYYYNSNRADPDCFLCTNKQTILKMLNTVRYQTTKEVMSIVKNKITSGEDITLTSLPEVSSYEKDLIWLN